MKIEMVGINKSFSKNKVLKDACFHLESGEIHALMGENGAGKSTLMKILTGVYKKDSGKILVDGKSVEYKHPVEAEKSGIVFIHQELNVVPDLTVIENLFLGKELRNKFGILNEKLMKYEASEIFKVLGVEIDLDDVIGKLSIGKQQMVEIAKALMANAKVLIMDEPTAALTPRECNVLFDVVRYLRGKGVSIVYISHRMEEIFELCDRITILRDGNYVGTKFIKQTTMDEIIKMMIGREITEKYPKIENELGDIVLKVENLTKKGMFENISFEVRKGEILGVSGLMGAGRSEIMNVIFGNIKVDEGKIIIDDNEVNIRSPRDAINFGIGFVTEDRKNEGLILDSTIRENIALTNLDLISNKFGIIDSNKEIKTVEKDIEKFKIKCSSSEQICGGLSGGNQQKVVFAKWIDLNPKIFILDEPTRGVDVGSKKEIYNIINELIARGVGIILVSSELPEVLGLSDRVLVINEGKVSGILNRKDATQENVMKLAVGGSLL